jgi:hypothetical protein
MGVLPAFFIAFFVLAIVVAPLLRIEDRPGFKRLDRPPRPDVGGWFRR